MVLICPGDVFFVARAVAAIWENKFFPTAPLSEQSEKHFYRFTPIPANRLCGEQAAEFQKTGSFPRSGKPRLKAAAPLQQEKVVR